MKYHILIKEKGLALVENWPDKPKEPPSHWTATGKWEDYENRILPKYKEKCESALSNAIDIAAGHNEQIVWKCLLHQHGKNVIDEAKPWEVFPIEFDGKVAVRNKGNTFKQLAYFLPSLPGTAATPTDDDIIWARDQLKDQLESELEGEQGAVEKDQSLETLMFAAFLHGKEGDGNFKEWFERNNFNGMFSPPTDKSQEELWREVSQRIYRYYDSQEWDKIKNDFTLIRKIN